MAKKILIGEDEKPMANALELKLKSAGFEVKKANDGEEVLKLLKSEKFDLVFLDLIMPKLDGFGVLEAIKSEGIKTPIVITSNLSQDEDKKKTKELGAVDFLVKSNTPISEIVKKAQEIIK